MKNIPRNYHTEKDVKQAIKEKQSKYETSSMSSNDEKKLLKDIDALKKALPDMSKLTIIEPELASIREEKKKIQDGLSLVQRLIDDKESKIQDVKQASQAQRDKQSEVRDNAEVFTVLIDKGNEKLSGAYKEKDKLREEYYKNLYEFELQNDKIRHIKGMINQQKKLNGVIVDKEDRIAKKREEIENRVNPHLKEIETCEHLLQYCNKLKAQCGLNAPSSEQVAKSTEKEMINEYNRQDIEQKLKDGKLMAVHKKEDSVVQIGGGKGKKGKKKNTQKNEASSSFNIDIVAINKFGLISVSPPIAPSDLDEKIEELTARQKKFLTDGEQQLKQEKENLENDIEKAVEDDLEAERKALLEEAEYGYEEEEKSYDDRRTGHRGRGGFGGRNHGDRDRNYDGEEGGYFGKTKKKGEPKGEFDGSSDDEEESYMNSTDYAKPTRGGG